MRGGGIIVLFIGLFLSGCSALDEADTKLLAGPIPHRSMMPLSLIFPHPRPERSSVLSRGTVEAGLQSTYSSIFVSKTKRGETVLVDGEFQRTALTLRCGLGRRVEINAEIPFLRYTHGFLDDFIENWHDFFGMPQGGRDRNPDDRYAANYTNGAGTFFSAHNHGFHLGDVPLTVKVNLLDPDSDVVGMALRGLVEFPTGNDSSGFGNGKMDAAAGALFEKRFELLTLYTSVDHAIRRSPSSFRGGVHAAPVTHVSFAAEVPFGRRFSLVAQTDYQTRPLKGAHMKVLTRPQWSGGFGGAFRLGKRSVLRVYFIEDFITHTSPDFTAGAEISWRF